MKAAENDPATLRKHMTRTYLNLRVGIALIGAALPLLLWFGDWIFGHVPLRGSMSAYYYSPAMRNTFVGALITIGAVLYLYKGFSTTENWALNLAGAFAVGVAMVPTSPPPPPSGAVVDSAQRTVFTWHGTFAVLFFLCIAYVCIFRASDTLSLIAKRSAARAKRLHRTYRLLGIGMIISPLAAVAVNYFLRGTWRTFFIEWGAVWIFAIYWLVKSRELEDTDAEDLALAGKLKAVPKPRKAQSGPEGRLQQV